MYENENDDKREQEGNGPIDFGRHGLWKIQVQILAASKPPNSLRGLLPLDLKRATLVYMSILPPAAILLASEAMAFSKQHLRSLPASDLNSMTSNTYVQCLSGF